jgi:hypothetical protein
MTVVRAKTLDDYTDGKTKTKQLCYLFVKLKNKNADPTRRIISSN